MATVTMRTEVAVAANGQTDNVFSGKRFERAPFPAFLTLLDTGSAAGLTRELNVGGRSITPADVVNTGNRVPVVPDDLVVSDVEVYPGELIQVTVRNTTGGALTYRGQINLEEAGMG